jgi:hypothetical protein
VGEGAVVGLDDPPVDERVDDRVDVGAGLVAGDESVGVGPVAVGQDSPIRSPRERTLTGSQNSATRSACPLSSMASTYRRAIGRTRSSM